MATTKKGFKYWIKRFVSVFASREFAFVYCVLGTIGQIAHCYFLVNSVSSFDGAIRTAQAIVISTFISSSLLYFVAIADKDDSDYKRVIRAVNMFMIIEITINIYYYGKHLLLSGGEIRVFDFIFATIISAILPVTIKLYANSIMAKKWMKEIDDESGVVDGAAMITTESLEKSIFDMVERALDERMKSVNVGEKSIDVESLRESILSQVRESAVSTQVDLTDVDDKIKTIVDARISELSRMLDSQIDNKVNFQMDRITKALPIRSIIDGQIKNM